MLQPDKAHFDFALRFVAEKNGLSPEEVISSKRLLKAVHARAQFVTIIRDVFGVSRKVAASQVNRKESSVGNIQGGHWNFYNKNPHYRKNYLYALAEVNFMWNKLHEHMD